jgi:asparagine synthase (glutamine-hydrolysing)
MCGILALYNLDGTPVDPELLRNLRDVMTHRGPDDAGLYTDGPLGLGHRRLSIVDLTPSGHQPMCNEDGSVWMVFNGEIYNYVELAVELERRGHRFRSRTDSEVIIHLYEELGPKCVDRLNGMFGFVIWDRRTNTLFGARDRAGIKPLYYYADAARFVCASEVKAILEHPAVPRAPDPEGMAGWLFSGAPTGGRTLFAGIRQLPPGYAFSIAEGRFTTWKYWDVEFRYDLVRALADTVEELAHLVDDAVRIQCRSDAPLGCHLSGGLDSSTVVALTARHRKPVQAFSIRFDEGSPYDESRYSSAVADHVGAERFVATPTAADLIRLLPSLIWHMDAPLMPESAFSYHTVSALASEHVKVSMTGHGGDEVFAGYPAQFRAAYGSTAMFNDLGGLGHRTSALGRARMAMRRHGLLGMASRLLRRALPVVPRADDTLEQLWVRLHCASTPADDPLLHPDLRRAIGSYDPADEYLAPLRSAATPEILDRCLYHDLRHYLPILLHAEDRVSMARSLESRVPLLDHRIIEFLATVPPAQKTAGMRPKALLRRAARRWLPAMVIDRTDKGPFAVPTNRWLSRELVPLTRQVLRSRSTLERGVFDPRLLRNGLVEQVSPWVALNVELWYRIFFDRDREWLDRIGEAHSHTVPAPAVRDAPQPVTASA